MMSFGCSPAEPEELELEEVNEAKETVVSGEDNIASDTDGGANAPVSAPATKTPVKASNEDKEDNEEKAASLPEFGALLDLVAVATVTIDSISLVNSGAAVTDCTSSPELPAGLVLEVASDSCKISGAASEVVDAADYKITGKSANGSEDSVSFNITVNAALSPVFAAMADIVVESGSAITPVSFTNSGAAAISCSSDPELPNGLVVLVDSDTCQIS